MQKKIYPRMFHLHALFLLCIPPYLLNTSKMLYDLFICKNSGSGMLLFGQMKRAIKIHINTNMYMDTFIHLCAHICTYRYTHT